MALHQRTHPTPVDECFGCKIATLHVGVVPGAYRQTGSGKYIDTQALEESFPKSGYDQILEETDGVGTLRPSRQFEKVKQQADGAEYSWDYKEFHKKDRKSGDWVKATSKDVDKVLFGKEGPPVS